jgi:hypothetical protein
MLTDAIILDLKYSTTGNISEKYLTSLLNCNCMENVGGHTLLQENFLKIT